MQKDIHPKTHLITVVMTDGDSFQIRSTWGKPDDVFHLEIDPKSHVAWTKKRTTVDRGRAAEFNQRFRGLNLQ